MGVHYRPFMKDTLRRLKKDWELILFTASAPEYANRIINAIDPDGSLFNFRLYRKNCYLTEKGIYIKDLRIVERPLERVLLIDNAAYSYGFQPFNGIPIIPFLGSRQDAELLFLSDYLDYIKDAPDFRKVNKEMFKYHMFSGPNIKLNTLMKKIFK